MTTSPVLVQTRDLTKRYGDRAAVDRINLTIRPGEVYGFLGPNGAGKTTTLRMVLGLVRPTSGSVQVFGLPAGDPKALARIGSLVEGPGFFPYLSGRDNLRVVARWAGVPERRVDRALDEVDLRGRGGDRYASYSLGMKQRLGVAATLLKDPGLLILDEPTNGLDPAGMADMRALIRRLGDEGRTVVLSSHLLSEVQSVCDRVSVIAKGRILAESSVADLIGEPVLIVRADPLDEAARIATQLSGVAVDIVGDALHIVSRTVDPARLNAELVGRGVAVRELTNVERSLEDVFFALTGEPVASDPEEVQPDAA
jgi:ABC-2 type transport system ATP-binding protein